MTIETTHAPKLDLSVPKFSCSNASLYCVFYSKWTLNGEQSQHHLREEVELVPEENVPRVHIHLLYAFCGFNSDI